MQLLGKLSEPRPFRSKVFLFRMLGCIFFVEAVFLGFAFYSCKQLIFKESGSGATVANRCPKVGDRAETLFVAAVATTLSLLTGASDDGGASSPAPTQLPPEGPQGPRSPARGRKSQQASEE